GLVSESHDVQDTERDVDRELEEQDQEQPAREPPTVADRKGVLEGRRVHDVPGTKTRNTCTGSSRPFTTRGPIDSLWTPGAALTVDAEATTSPASASDCSRDATFTASPTTVYSSRPPPPTVPAITEPVFTPIPTPNSGNPST